MTAVKKDMHYFHTERTQGKKDFGPSVTKPNQGFRMKELIARMTAGAPPPVGRSTVFVDPKYGVDPLARYDVPIEEMAQIAENARQRIVDIEAEREAYIAEQNKQQNEPTPATT